MFKNRFVLILAALSMLLVTLAVSQPFSKPPKTGELGQRPRHLLVPVTGVGEYYEKLEESQLQRSQAVDAARWEAMGEYYLNQSRREYLMDSATRSCIAWGKALQAAGKLGVSGTCPNTTQENIFARIPNSLDSATRSYIAWGLALQAKNDFGALCR